MSKNHGPPHGRRRRLQMPGARWLAYAQAVGGSPSYGNFKGNRFKTMGCGETPNNYVGKVLGGWHEWASGGPPKK